jgi:hypothetical protein
VQPLLPLIPDEDAAVQIAIEEDGVAVVDQPPAQLVGRRQIPAGEADEDPGHGPSRRSAPCLVQGREAATRGQRQEL